MKKILITDTIVKDLDLGGRNLSDVIEEFHYIVQDAGAAGFSEIRFDYKYDYDGYRVDIVGERLETDEEHRERLDHLKKKKAQDEVNRQKKLKKALKDFPELQLK